MVFSMCNGCKKYKDLPCWSSLQANHMDPKTEKGKKHAIKFFIITVQSSALIGKPHLLPGDKIAKTLFYVKYEFSKWTDLSNIPIRWIWMISPGVKI